MFPSALRSPQPKRISIGSAVFTSHGRVSSDIPGMCFPIKIAPLHNGIWTSIKRMVPWVYPRPTTKMPPRFSSAICAQSSDMLEHALPPKIAPSHGCVWPPSNTRFIEPSRVHNPNSISVGSAVFAQLTRDCRRTFRGMFFPLKIAPSHRRSEPPLKPWFYVKIKLF